MFDLWLGPSADLRKYSARRGAIQRDRRACQPRSRVASRIGDQRFHAGTTSSGSRRSQGARSRWLHAPPAGGGQGQGRRHDGPNGGLRSSCVRLGVERGAMSVNPFAALPIVKSVARRERVLSDAELAEIWRVFERDFLYFSRGRIGRHRRPVGLDWNRFGYFGSRSNGVCAECRNSLPLCYVSRLRFETAIQVPVQCLSDRKNVVTRIGLQQILSDQDIDFRFA